MARVHLTPSLGQFTGGALVFEIDAATIKHLLAALVERHPALEPHFASGVAVAIDGTIFQDDLFSPIPADSEVHILPMISGG